MGPPLLQEDACPFDSPQQWTEDKQERRVGEEHSHVVPRCADGPPPERGVEREVAEGAPEVA